MLPNILIFDFELSSEQAIVRLFGSRLLSIAGQDLTGQNFVEFAPEQSRSMMRQMLELCVSTPIGLVDFVPIEVSGRLGQLTEVTLLPYLGNDGQFQIFGLAQVIDSFLSAFDCDDKKLVLGESHGMLPLDLGAGIPQLPNDVSRLRPVGTNQFTLRDNSFANV